MKILYCEHSISEIHHHDCPVTLLADSSLSRNHLPLFLPPGHEHDMLVVAPAFRISRLGRFIAPRFASRYYNSLSLMARLVPPGGLKVPASATLTSFDSAAVVGEWIQLPDPPAEDLTLKICINEGEAIGLNIKLQDLNDTVSYLSQYFTLRNGDIIIPGMLSPVFPVIADTTFTAAVGSSPCLQFKIK